jgi:hypothetical protein
MKWIVYLLKGMLIVPAVMIGMPLYLTIGSVIAMGMGESPLKPIDWFDDHADRLFGFRKYKKDEA